jgi:hypothetical protein
MNIFLIPHTLSRHFAVAFSLASATAIVWWLFLNVAVGLSPLLYQYGALWYQEVEGAALLGLLAATCAFASIASEGALRRTAVHWRAAYALAGALTALVLTALWVVGVQYAIPYLVSERISKLVADPSLATLRYSILQWMGAGLFAGVGGIVGRLIAQILDFIRVKVNAKKPRTIPEWLDLPEAPGRPAFFAHLAGGLSAGLMAGAVWQLFGHHILGDLYYAAAFGSVSFGFFFGLLVWGIPSDLYAGWVRVLSAEKYGLRIPIDRVDGTPAERIVGNFPRGLDIRVAEDLGAAELHASFVVDHDHHYAVRGLSQRPAVVKRMLERIDLSYDPRSPAPLETELKMEDRILLGEPAAGVVELEFILLPKEER